MDRGNEITVFNLNFSDDCSYIEFCGHHYTDFNELEKKLEDECKKRPEFWLHMK
jgi:hypothetical protein